MYAGILGGQLTRNNGAVNTVTEVALKVKFLPLEGRPTIVTRITPIGEIFGLLLRKHGVVKMVAVVARPLQLHHRHLIVQQVQRIGSTVGVLARSLGVVRTSTLDVSVSLNHQSHRCPMIAMLGMINGSRGGQ